MIGGCAAGFQDANFAAGLLGDARQHEQKILAADAPGATASDQNSADFQKIYSDFVQVVVGHEGGIRSSSTAGKFGRVQNHGTEFFTPLVQFVEEERMPPSWPTTT